MYDLSRCSTSSMPLTRIYDGAHSTYLFQHFFGSFPAIPSSIIHIHLININALITLLDRCLFSMRLLSTFCCKLNRCTYKYTICDVPSYIPALMGFIYAYNTTKCCELDTLERRVLNCSISICVKTPTVPKLARVGVPKSTLVESFELSQTDNPTTSRLARLTLKMMRLQSTQLIAIENPIGISMRFSWVQRQIAV